VAGGIGQPRSWLFREFASASAATQAHGTACVQRVTLVYGVAHGELAAGVDDFRAAGATVHLATDDGSLSFRGFVTSSSSSQEKPQHLVGCGPEAMMKGLRRWQSAGHAMPVCPWKRRCLWGRHLFQLRDAHPQPALVDFAAYAWTDRSLMPALLAWEKHQT